MTVADEFAYRMSPDDMTVDGLARLEREVLRDHPDVLSRIDEVVSGFTPTALEIERKHSGRELMAPVGARRTADARSSAHPLLAFASFALLVLPALALGISIRGAWDFAGNATAVAALLDVSAVLCVIKAVSTARDRVWAGVLPHWALAAASLAVVTSFRMLYVSNALPAHGADGPLIAMSVSAVVIVLFAVLTVARTVGAARRRRADLAPTESQVASYLREFTPKYDVALARIQDAVATLSPEEQKKLKMHRDSAISYLHSARGLYQGAVPLYMNKKVLGEFALFAVGEPLTGGGVYPKSGKLKATRSAS